MSCFGSCLCHISPDCYVPLLCHALVTCGIPRLPLPCFGYSTMFSLLMSCFSYLYPMFSLPQPCLLHTFAMDDVTSAMLWLPLPRVGFLFQYNFHALGPSSVSRLPLPSFVNLCGVLVTCEIRQLPLLWFGKLSQTLVTSGMP